MARATTGLWRAGGARVRLRVVVNTMIAVSTMAASGCGGVADDNQLPPDVQDPATLRTPKGAIDRYHGALATLPEALDHYLTMTGILTDELADSPTPLGAGGAYTGIDSRTNLTGFEPAYNLLNRVRGQAHEARGFVQTYASDSSASLVGHLYTLEGYAEVLLADLFCSGIPLSTVDFNGDYTFAAGSSTADVYRHALALFDTALTLEGDSVRLQHFTATVRGRVLLALGRYAEAATAVAAVPDDYEYQTVFVPTIAGETSNRLLWTFVGSGTNNYTHVPATPGMADSEGGNGLPYRSSNDPRTPTKLEGSEFSGHLYYFPAKYRDDFGSVTLTVADGIEARLTEAEAALQGGDASIWLAKLNALRTDDTFDTLPDASDPAKTDTLWHSGSGGVDSLAPLADPGTPDGRIDLMFRERAFWLYLTGHRQGDLRRLVRVYGRPVDAVYPSGSYSGGPGAYGGEVSAPVPQSEQDLNPRYTGCLTRGA